MVDENRLRTINFYVNDSGRWQSGLEEPLKSSSIKGCSPINMIYFGERQPNNSMDVSAKQRLFYIACLFNSNGLLFGFAPRLNR